MKSKNHRPRNRRERIARERALAALSVMRRDKLSLTAAAKAVKTDPETIQRYVGSALVRKGSRGRYRARAYDRIPRTLNHYTPGRSVAVTVNSSRTASLIAEYSNAVKSYLNNRADESVLQPFVGKSFPCRESRLTNSSRIPRFSRNSESRVFERKDSIGRCKGVAA